MPYDINRDRYLESKGYRIEYIAALNDSSFRGVDMKEAQRLQELHLFRFTYPSGNCVKATRAEVRKMCINEEAKCFIIDNADNLDYNVGSEEFKKLSLPSQVLILKHLEASRKNTDTDGGEG